MLRLLQWISLIRFWKYAKDSAARRIGLVAKETPQGGDPALLP
jgi:hypothetical protein